MDLEIIYKDEFLAAVNKPPGLLVHPSALARDAEEFAMQMLRNQMGRHVYPAHRLDRKTSGVLLFSLDKDTDSLMQQLFAAGSVHKTYVAIVRGYTKDEETIDYPLRKENGRMQDAVTRYKTLARAEINLPDTRHQTSRYSLVKVNPDTGRMHQIRRHFAHILHPIIGDRPHGCNKQNKLFKEKFDMTTMLLHASEISFVHPLSGEKIEIRAELSDEFNRMLRLIFNKIDSQKPV
ncbi:MAG: tRNA pseudouridine(65) synthase TruC [Bacteroidales bacterium]|nr:tRNA pseudouridine(65) synthase TruC [Bacteroidales bacterium]